MDLKKILSEQLNRDFVSQSSVSGGCISPAYQFMDDQGESVFVKTMPHAKDQFLKEANGLNELSKSGVFAIPQVFLQSAELLVLEFLPSGQPKKNMWQEFGQNLAQMHLFQGERYGFFEDNYIGRTLQINTASPFEAWSEFFWTQRIEFQMSLAFKNGFAESLKTAFLKAESQIVKLLEEVEPVPSLLHGDLWSGNYHVGREGCATLIDPAVYYGDRETDLAMTQLFGGFSEEFYSAYESSFPRLEGWQERLPIYNLYHVLNHLNLFGSGYLAQVQSILRKYQ